MTEQENGNGIKVTFTVKELLVDISRDIKDLRSDLNTKADKGLVDTLIGRVDKHELALNTLQTQDKQSNRWKDLWIPVIASIVVGLIIGAVSVLTYTKL